MSRWILAALILATGCAGPNRVCMSRAELRVVNDAMNAAVKGMEVVLQRVTEHRRKYHADWDPKAPNGLLSP